MLKFLCHITNKIAIFEEAPWVYYLKILLKMVKCIPNEPSKRAVKYSHREACLTENYKLIQIEKLLAGNPSP